MKKTALVVAAALLGGGADWQDAAKGWQAYREGARKLQGSYTWDSVKSGPEQGWRTRRNYQIRQRSGCALFMEQCVTNNNEPDPVGWVWVLNENYGFELKRTQCDGPWTLHSMDDKLSDGVQFDLAGAPATRVDAVSLCPVSLASIVPINRQSQIHTIDADPAFSLVSMAPEGDLVRVTFSYGDQVVRGGWMLCDPKRLWIIRECETRMAWGDTTGTVRVTMDYDDGSFPILRHMAKLKPPTKPPGWTGEDHYNFDLNQAKASEDEFTLPAFGFAELPQFEKPSRWYLWVGGVGVACLLAALIWRWLATR
jgi:hypothetical protein